MVLLANIQFIQRYFNNISGRYRAHHGEPVIDKRKSQLALCTRKMYFIVNIQCVRFEQILYGNHGNHKSEHNKFFSS